MNFFYSHGDVENFLKDEDVHLFPTITKDGKHTIRYAYDIDGLVIELKDLNAVKTLIHYLMVGKFVGMNHWHSLKKHLPLKQCNAAGVSAFKKTFSHTLAFVDAGFLLNMHVITAEIHHPHLVFKAEVV